ncbi:MAG: hypothetical protein JWQ09_1586 [Segetibacter sp.]|nr:hypothetical protein [Segetibacter sp.]
MQPSSAFAENHYQYQSMAVIAGGLKILST